MRIIIEVHPNLKIELNTSNVETHALMSDYPQAWQEINDYIREKLMQCQTSRMSHLLKLE
jgi:hypothetical protein